MVLEAGKFTTKGWYLMSFLAVSSHGGERDRDPSLHKEQLTLSCNRRNPLMGTGLSWAKPTP